MKLPRAVLRLGVDGHSLTMKWLVMDMDRDDRGLPRSENLVVVVAENGFRRKTKAIPSIFD